MLERIAFRRRYAVGIINNYVLYIDSGSRDLRERSGSSRPIKGVSLL